MSDDQFKEIMHQLRAIRAELSAKPDFIAIAMIVFSAAIISLGIYAMTK